MNVQDNKKVVVVTENNKFPLTEDEIGNHFQVTFSEEGLNDYRQTYRLHGKTPLLCMNLLKFCIFRYMIR